MVFLEPEIRSGDVEGSEAVQDEDVFRRAKVKQSRKHWKYVQEEDRYCITPIFDKQ